MINEKSKEGFVNVEFLTSGKNAENTRFIKIKNILLPIKKVSKKVL